MSFFKQSYHMAKLQQTMFRRGDERRDSMSSQVTSSSDDLFREYNVSMPKFAMPDEVPQPQQYPKTTNLQNSRNPVIDRLMGKVMSESFIKRSKTIIVTLSELCVFAGICRDRAVQHPERELLHGDQPRHVERGAAEAAHAAVGGEQEGERAPAAAGVSHGAPEVRRGIDD